MTQVVKVEPRTARLEVPLIAIPEVPEKVRLPAATRKKRRFYFRIVEARHGLPTVQSESARRDNQVAALQCNVAESSRLAKSSIVDGFERDYSLSTAAARLSVYESDQESCFSKLSIVVFV